MVNGPIAGPGLHYDYTLADDGRAFPQHRLLRSVADDDAWTKPIQIDVCGETTGTHTSSMAGGPAAATSASRSGSARP